MTHIQACSVKLRTVTATSPAIIAKAFALCMQIARARKGTASTAKTRPLLKSEEARNVRAAAPITLEVLVRDAANLLTLD